MKAFIAALIAIGVVSVIAAMALENFAGSSQDHNASNSVRIN